MSGIVRTLYNFPTSDEESSTEKDQEDASKEAANISADCVYYMIHHWNNFGRTWFLLKVKSFLSKCIEIVAI